MHHVSSSWTLPPWHYRKDSGEMLCPRDLKVKEQTLNKTWGETTGKKNSLDLAKLWKHNSPGTCDSPNKLFSHRRDLRLSNTAFHSLTRTHIAHTERRVQGRAGAHERDALKNKPSFGQSGFRWLGCSSKASSSLGQLIISMDARRWCSQVWCTSIKRPGSSAHGSRLQSHLSGSKDRALSPSAAIPESLVRDEELGSPKKKSKLNSAAAKGNPRPDHEEEEERKITQRCQVLQEWGREKTDV